MFDSPSAANHGISSDWLRSRIAALPLDGVPRDLGTSKEIMTMRALLAIAAVVAALLLAPAPQLHAADGASFDDTAKFLAGMQPSANSPLAPLTRENELAAARQATSTRTGASLDSDQLGGPATGRPRT